MNYQALSAVLGQLQGELDKIWLKDQKQKEKYEKFRENHHRYCKAACEGYTDAIGVEYITNAYGKKEAFEDALEARIKEETGYIAYSYLRLCEPALPDPAEFIREFCIGDEGISAFAEWYYDHYIVKEAA